MSRLGSSALAFRHQTCGDDRTSRLRFSDFKAKQSGESDNWAQPHAPHCRTDGAEQYRLQIPNVNSAKRLVCIHAVLLRTPEYA